MATARKDIADYINDQAMLAGKCLVKSITSDGGQGPSQTQVTAAKAILDKCIPNIKAVEMKADVSVTVQELIIGEYAED